MKNQTIFLRLFLINILLLLNSQNVFCLNNAELERIEKTFWESCPSRGTAKQSADTVAGKVFDAAQPSPPPTNLTRSPRWEIVKHLDIVQSKKHQARRETQAGGAVNYITQYQNPYVNADPVPENVIYHNRTFRFALNYNGNPMTKQPGNFYFTEPGQPSLVYSHVQAALTLQSPDAQLLLLGEISRRHAYDQIRRIPDEFCSLPVGLSLAMADSLISDGHIILSDFWKNDGQFHVYSGNGVQRAQAVQSLYAKYAQHYMNGLFANQLGPDHEDLRKKHLLNLMYSYFEVPVDNLNNDFAQFMIVAEQ